ncbi:MAG: DinB family protein [Candidatus Hinthialibacter antarcticus]|nr:DinB family protein [Candidatus Hinthialibacter antarcticus]
MNEFKSLRSQTILIHECIANWVEPRVEVADVVPHGWKNNLLWHVGHLVLVPRMLTDRLAGKDVSAWSEYTQLFGRGTSPLDWKDVHVPSLETLCDQLRYDVIDVFDQYESDWALTFDKPFATQTGVVLGSVSDALRFSLFHNGVHFGMMMRLVKDIG